MTNSALDAPTRDAALRELAAILPGQLTLPADAGWDELRLGWTRSVDQRPCAVLTVADEEDIVAAVRCAAKHGLSVSAQPVGHGATTAVNGTVLLRTRALREITVDVAARTARVGAGVKWGELLAATGEHGLTGLSGSSPDPSVVGFTLGGGLSWFGRAYGLAAHHVLAFDVVDPTGVLRRVTAASDPDLFWALRGGGGDFAVVTAMEIALHPAPHVYGGRLLWPLADALPVLRAFRDITASAPDELTVWAQLLRFPPMEEIPEPLRGGSFVSIDLTFLGDAVDAGPYLAPLQCLADPLLDTRGTVPLDELGAILAEPIDPLPTAEFSGLIDRLDDDAIEALLTAAGPDSDCPVTVVQLRHLGGAFGRATEADGPSGAISEPYQLGCIGIPFSPEVAAGITKVYAHLADTLAGHLTGRTFFTFLGAEDDPASAFSPAALERLRQIKSRVDPGDVVRGNRPVLAA
jgi:hypothetical protein